MSTSRSVAGAALVELAASARSLVDHAPRALLGLAGAPGAGKSTLAQALTSALNAETPGFAVHLSMDGFHLADVVLAAHRTLGRKGAPETFDAWGYVHLLRLLRSAPAHPVYGPDFAREIEQPLAAAVEVPPQARLIVSEGNYLLLAEEPWAQLRGLFDEIWYCEAEDDRRRRHLVARHVRFGKTAEAAANWVDDVDEANAARVAATRQRADRIVATY